MSALTKADIAARARERITDKPEAQVGYTIPRLQTLVDGALKKLARMVAADPTSRDLLMPADPFPATLVAGKVDLQTVIDANAILLDYVYGCEIRLADVTINPFPFQWVMSIGKLSLTRITDALTIHCCLTGTLLETKNTDGSLVTLEGDIGLTVNFIPTMLQLPVSLEDRPRSVRGEARGLIDIVTDMARQDPAPRVAA